MHKQLSLTLTVLIHVPNVFFLSVDPVYTYCWGLSVTIQSSGSIMGVCNTITLQRNIFVVEQNKSSLWIFCVFVLYCVCYIFVHVCLCVLCGHLLGKG